jgi:hypothetical protein
MINTIHITNTTNTTHTIIYIYKCVPFPTYICVLTKQKEETENDVNDCDSCNHYR